MAGKWIRVSLPYATFGLRVEEGFVVEAAPIARWTIGKDERTVADYYRKKGATFITLGGHPSEPADQSPRSADE